MQAYRLLDSLVEKQFAENTLERPKRYMATDVDEALSQYLDNYHQTLSQLREREKEVVQGSIEKSQSDGGGDRKE